MTETQKLVVDGIREARERLIHEAYPGTENDIDGAIGFVVAAVGRNLADNSDMSFDEFVKSCGYIDTV